MSPDSPGSLPAHRRPPAWGGTGKDPVWELSSEELGRDLSYRVDPSDPEGHGYVEPEREMGFNEYQGALTATREIWREVLP